MPTSSYKQRLFNYGHSVGKRATLSWPEGIFIDISREHHETALEKTKEAFSKNPSAIFEGAFLYQEVLVRVDILKNNFDGTWDLIEVKSSKLKPNPHYDDVAIQKWVLLKNNIQIKNAFLMTPVRGFIPGVLLDPSEQFVLQNLNQEIEPHVQKIDQNIFLFQESLNTDEPARLRGDHCNKPYECEFKKYCRTYSTLSSEESKTMSKLNISDSGMPNVTDIL